MIANLHENEYLQLIPGALVQKSGFGTALTLAAILNLGP